MGGFVVQFKEVALGSRVQMAASSKLLTLASSQIKDLDANNSQLKVTKLIIATKREWEKALPTVSTTSMTASKTSSNSTTTVERSKETAFIPDKRLGRMITLRENSLPGSNSKNSFLVKEVIADLRSRLFSGEDMGFSFTSLVDTISNLIRLSEEHWALD
jgi:hypothetical protein